MSHRNCPACSLPMDAATAVIDQIDGERVAVCVPCAEDRGWFVPGPRRPLADRVDAVTAQGVAAAERHASPERAV